MLKGQKTTPEIRLRMSLAKKGKSNGRLGYKHTEETKRKMSEKAKLKNFMKGRFGELNHNYGRKFSESVRSKMSLGVLQSYKDGRNAPWSGKTRLDMLKDSNYNWKGGITPLNSQIRNSLEYKLWRKAVFTRDDFTCIWCFKRGGILHADHIKEFYMYPELRFAIDNGRTLCKSCHLIRHSKHKYSPTC